MPRVRLHARTAELLAGREHFAEEEFLHRDDDDEHGEREGRGRVMRRQDFANALHRKSDGGCHDDERDDDRGHDLGLPVAVRVLVVGRLGGHFQADPNDD